MSEQPANNPSKFIEDLLRRRVFRVISMYLVVCFILLQIGDMSFEPLGLPEWSQKLLIILLALGLPVVAVLAWVFDVTPQGVVKTAAQGEVTTQLSFTRKLDVLIIFVLVAALGFVLGRDYFFDASPSDQTLAYSVDRSVAVLPLKNIGSDNSYFAEGLTEELVSALSAIHDLKVTAASSSLRLQTSNETPQNLGKILNAAHLVQGSVRKAGEDVRIALQLIRADDGSVLWSETFDRTLADIFAIQDEVATSVAKRLQSTLYTASLGRQAAQRTTNVAAYDAYLQALHYRSISWAKALEYAQRAATLDPNFVSAHNLLAQIYALRVGGIMPGAQAQSAARRAIETSLSLNPDYAPSLIVQGNLERQSGDYAAAEALFRKAKQNNPNGTTRDLANLLLLMGRIDEALYEYQRSFEIDPLDAGFYASVLFSNGDFQQSQQLLERSVDLLQGRARTGALASLATQSAFLGDVAQANRWIDAALATKDAKLAFVQGLLAYAMAGCDRREEAEAIVAKLEVQQQKQYVSPSGLFWGYLGLGNLDQTFHWLNLAIEENALVVVIGLKTSPMYDEIRDDPRFDDALDKLGLLPESTNI